jgi:MOSC domain
MKTRLTGIVTGVYVGLRRHTIESTRVPGTRATFEGLEGDNHAGLMRLSDVRVPHYPRRTVIRNTRQFSMLSVEELAEVAAALRIPEVLPEWVGANLAMQGIPNLTMLPPSTRIFFPGDAVLVVDAENLPCTGPGEAIQQHYPDMPKLVQFFPKAAMHKRGVVGWVEREGYIAEGDTAWLLLPPQVTYSY